MYLLKRDRSPAVAFSPAITRFHLACLLQCCPLFHRILLHWVYKLLTRKASVCAQTAADHSRSTRPAHPIGRGAAIDPKEEAVYVLESTRNDCLRIALKKDGTFGKPEIYAQDFPAIPDGMAFDVEGHLYVTLPGTPKDGTTR
jgi:hypothetical protein